VEEFAKRVEEVAVVAQYVGQCDLPNNVKVFSLGKEKGYSKLRQLFNFYKLLFKNLPKIDKVFVHMIPMWVILGAPIFKIFRKKVFLWYTHKSVRSGLKLAEKFVSKIFTASKESCRLDSEKIIITGHGIDVDKFSAKNRHFGEFASDGKIITAGRIAAVKNLDVLIEVGDILSTKSKRFGGPIQGWQIEIAGSAILDKDKIYFEKLKNLIKEKGLEEQVKFVGPIPYSEIEKFYQQGNLFVNLSNTGSVDKAVLEAMSCGLDVLVSNEAFFEMLPEENIIRELNPQIIIDKIKNFINNPNKERSLLIRKIVVDNHNLENLIRRIIECLKNEH